MHEVIGHGSGKVGPKVTHEPAYYIKEYYSTLEESRADLMAFWSFWDPKLIQMGVMPNEEVAKAAYDSEARAALTQLHEVPSGDTIEEDHRRGTQLIVNYIRDKTGAIQPVEHDGKDLSGGHGLREDAPGSRNAAVGTDAHQGRRRLRCGQGADHEIRDPFRSRVARSGGRALQGARIFPRIGWESIPIWNCAGAPGGKMDVTISYPRDLMKQQLAYTKINGE